MGQLIGLISIVVPDYDPAIDFFVGGLGFELTQDLPQGDKRWVVVKPVGAETGIVLGRAANPQQTAAIGDQTGGRVAFFLHTDDFDRDASRIKEAGGSFEEAPRHEAYGTVAVFRDPFGNRWDLIQSTT